jgi:tRNA modification GTPase
MRKSWRRATGCPAITGEGLAELKQGLVAHASGAMPRPGEAALNRRQRGLVEQAAIALESAAAVSDPLLLAEDLRLCRLALDRLVGRSGTEDVLDALFGRFCIGKVAPVSRETVSTHLTATAPAIRGAA